MKIVVQDSDAVAAWMANALGTSAATAPYTAIGWVDDDGDPIGGVLFSNYNRGGNVDVAVVWKGRLQRSVLYHVGAYVFGQLGCRRMTIITRKNRRDVIGQAERMGFRCEGEHPEYFPDGDGVSLGVLASHWRWLA